MATIAIGQRVAFGLKRRKNRLETTTELHVGSAVGIDGRFVRVEYFDRGILRVRSVPVSKVEVLP